MSTENTCPTCGDDTTKLRQALARERENVASLKRKNHLLKQQIDRDFEAKAEVALQFISQVKSIVNGIELAESTSE